ncbi:MAG: LLM class flavin-dependent oxidoreductase [Acidimicrobiales bacterium]
MKVGLTLPQFRHEAGPALATARQAEAAGLDGVFAFDHSWPLGRPDRPALHGHTLVGALLAETERISVGTLVARVGLLPNAVLANQFATLARMAGDRLVAGLGIGDAMSESENLAVGVPFRPRDERLASLVDVCRRLRGRGITTWVGGTSAAIRAVGAAEADAVNLWGVDAATVGQAGAGGGAGAVTWAGQVEVGAMGADKVAALLRVLALEGATWAVVAPVGTPWPEAVETVAAAARALVD